MSRGVEGHTLDNNLASDGNVFAMRLDMVWSLPHCKPHCTGLAAGWRFALPAINGLWPGLDEMTLIHLGLAQGTGSTGAYLIP